MAAIDSLRGLFGLKGGKPAGTAIGAAQIAARIGGRGEGAEATAEHARPAAGQTGRRAGGQHLMSDIDRASRAWRDGPTQPGTSIAGIDADPSTPETLAAAVEHLDARVSYVTARLEDLEDTDFPCIALLQDGSSHLINRRDSKFYHVDAEMGDRAIGRDVLEARQSGTVFFVRPRSVTSGSESEHVPFDGSENGFGVFRAVVAHIWDTRRGLLVQLMLATALSYVFLLALPLFTMAVYDRVVPHQAMETLWALSIGVLLALGLDFQLRFVRLKLVDAIGASAYLSLQARFFRRVLNARLASAPRSAGPIAHQVRDIEQVCNLAPSLLAALVVDVPFFCILMGVLYLIGGAVVIAPIVGVVALVALHALGHARTGGAIQKSAEISQKQSNQVFETVAALETVKAATAQSHLLRRWERISDEAGYFAHRARFWAGFASQSTLIVVQGVIVLVLIIGVYQIGDGNMSVGALAASSLLVGRMISPVGNLVSLLDRALQLGGALGGLAQVLALPQEEAGDTARGHPRVEGSVSLSGVGFSYPGASKPSLENINLSIRAGEHVGIVGRVGGGKSTLLRLVLRLHAPDEGSILLDGQDIRQFPPHVLRRACGFMRQDSVLFDDSLYNNICFGLDEVPEGDFEAAVTISGVAQLAANLSGGYSTPVGLRGDALSGGERQMVALARALVTKPNLLVLDEPTAAMDNALEQAVIRRLKPALEGRTLIVATHRVPVLDLVDRLVVVERGRIVADGPKREVLARLNPGKTA
ncbi:MAG: ATP-binding cassette domain-containing protein [Rhodobiaceae bacterium]|nr:ATP-binding cassette domain-containing protein [Rhodobiaceae bacterium]MCC0042445.1 ATP-binding cassette domain-containing protein [Rhodobiaceae bacterium]